MRSPGLGADDVRAREADEPGGDLALWIRCVRAERLMAESERRCALTERALSEGLATVQAVLDLAPIEMVMTDAEGHLVLVNSSAAEHMGRAREEILGLTMSDVFGPERAAGVMARELEVRALGVAITTETAVAPVGGDPDDLREYRITKAPLIDEVGQVAGVVTFAVDIAERRRAEARAERLAGIFETTAAAVVGMAVDGTIRSFNPAAERLYGYSAEEAIGRNVSLLIPPERHGEMSSNKTRINTGAGVGEIETVRRRKDGTDIHVAIALSPLLDEAGNIAGASTIARDITAQVQTREELRVSEERLRATIDGAPIGIALMAADGTVLRVNRALCEMLGYDEGELIARNRRDFNHPEDADDDAELIERMLAGEIPGYEIEKRYVRADGSTLHGQLAVTLARDRDGNPMHIVSHLQDIGRRKEDEARAAVHTREQEALSDVATLVAGEANPRPVFAAAAERVADILQADFARVVRLDADGLARLVGGWAAPHLPQPELGCEVDPDGPTATATALRTGRAAVVGGAAPVLVYAGVLSTLGLAEPVYVNGELWGAVSVGWVQKPDAPPQAAARLARFCNLVSLAVTGAEAREQLSRQASTDHLTGLFNLRTFSDRLDEEVARSRRHRRPLSLAVFDLDLFKLVNDTHGHQMGDRVLAEFAARLMSQRRDGDVIARVGGEEFAWIMPDTRGSSARAAAERARLAVAGTPFDGVGDLTTSIGVCDIANADDARALFRHADLALYWAKSGGRDAVRGYTKDKLAEVTAADQTVKLEDAKALAAIRALAVAVDAKDPSTQRHSERVAELAAGLAVLAGWGEERIALLRDAARVHDVGKIGVPDQILLKPSRLTEAEYERIKSHAALGAQMLDDLLGVEQIDWIRHHHERFDGNGYPDGIAGIEIAQGARLLALADAWDAMTVARPYGTPRSLEDALEECRREAGTHFCPEAVKLLVALRSGVSSEELIAELSQEISEELSEEISEGLETALATFRR
jgi:diguanylate cyclase (GGDEF)-like protein/PAS domain S-box-containing protein